MRAPLHPEVGAVLDAMAARRRDERHYADLLVESVGAEAAVAAALRIADALLTMVAEHEDVDAVQVLNIMRLYVELDEVTR